MIKKFLLALVILGAIGIAIMGYETYKVTDEILKEAESKLEPHLRQYIQLDEAAQNKYLFDNMNELFMNVDIDKDGKPEDEENLKGFMKLNDHPEIRSAFVNVARSVIAGTILHSDSIVKDMSADVKAKYQKEADEFEARADKYSKLVEAVDPTLKIDK